MTLRPAALLALGLALSAPLLAGCVPAAIGAGAGAATVAIQERGVSAAAADTRIGLQVNDLWFKSSNTTYSNLHLQVHEGRALVSGVVPNEGARAEAIRLAYQAEGVREVINEIQVGNTLGWGDSLTDTRIEADLNARLIADKAVRSVNYSVEVVNGVVYLLGIAQDQGELRRVVDHARGIAYVRDVRSYVRLKTEAAPGAPQPAVVRPAQPAPAAAPIRPAAPAAVPPAPSPVAPAAPRGTLKAEPLAPPPS
ncbi:MAG TPA: BON domain-containing protein [Alphaproteobacteria bacterium]|nr:BON domain-containing protein [Alphaproteobacteria bacterium]